MLAAAECGWTEAKDLIIAVMRELRFPEWGPWGALILIVAILIGLYIKAWGNKKGG